MGVSSNFLEPSFSDLSDGQQTDVVAQVLIFCPGAHVCRSMVNHQVFLTNAPINRNTMKMTLFKVSFLNGRRPWLDFRSDSFLLEHQSTNIEKLQQLIEGCAGIGAVDVGFRFLGVDTCLFVEQNPTFCKWVKDRYSVQVIQGDISASATAAEVAKQTGSGKMVSAGISCQPFSLDDHSRSFTGTLQLSYLLQSVMTILECTPQAKRSQWIQSHLELHSKLTGSTFKQEVLQMHHMWPGRRDRWWCTIAAEYVPLEDIPPMPSLRFDPFILHLIPNMMDSNTCDMKQLVLDDDELSAFQTDGRGIRSHCINTCKGMPTGKGIYGVLVPFEDAKQPHMSLRARHLHPTEVSLMCGLPPSYLQASDTSNIRLDLAGVGQCASPLQSLWVFANVLYQLQDKGLVQQVEHPRHSLAQFCRILLKERDEIWPHADTKYNRIFQHEINSIDHPFCFPSVEELDNMEFRPKGAGEAKLGARACTKIPRAGCTANTEQDPKPNNLIGTYETSIHGASAPDSGPCTKFPRDASEYPRNVGIPEDRLAAEGTTNTDRISPTVVAPIPDASDHAIISKCTGHPNPDRIRCTEASRVASDRCTDHIISKDAGHPNPDRIRCTEASRVTSDRCTDHIISKDTGHLNPDSIRCTEAFSVASERCTDHIISEGTGHPNLDCIRCPESSRVASERCTDQIISEGTRHPNPDKIRCTEASRVASDRCTDHIISKDAGHPNPDRIRCTEASRVTSDRCTDHIISKDTGHPNPDRIRCTEASRVASDRCTDHIISKDAGHPNPDSIRCTEASRVASDRCTDHIISEGTGHPNPDKIRGTEASRVASDRCTDQQMTSVASGLQNASVRRETKHASDAFADLGVDSREAQHGNVRSDMDERQPLSGPSVSTTKAKMNDRIAKGKGGYILASIAPHDQSLPTSINPVKEASQAMQITAFSTNGGVTGFETSKAPDSPPSLKRPVEESASNSTKRAKLDNPNAPDRVHQDGEHHQNEHQQISMQQVEPPESQIANTKTCWIAHENETMFPIAVSTESTIGQVVCAEAKFQHLWNHGDHPFKPVNGVGFQLSVSEIMPDHQLLIVQHGHNIGDPKGQPCLDGMKRSQALWHQKGWVAMDEMIFYLQTIHVSGTAVTTSPLDLRQETENPRILADWILTAVESAQESKQMKLMTAGLFKDHWFPIMVEVVNDNFTITTTYDMTPAVTAWIKAEMLDEYQQASGTHMPHAFANDCGFQTIAWIINQALDPDSNRAISPDEAESWRKNFAHHLVLSGAHDPPVYALPLGGTSDQHLPALRELLEKHGVNSNRSSQAAQALTQKLGADVIQRTLQSPKPWQDLKARASQLKPPFRIVLSEELQASIDSKIASGQAVGRKQHKAKQSKPQEPQRLIADQVQIPNTIFQQADGVLLQQISPSQFKAQCKGIACVSFDDATPFLQLKAPLTQEGPRFDCA